MHCVIVGECPKCNSEVTLRLEQEDNAFGTPKSLSVQPADRYHTTFHGNPTWCGCSCELTPPETYVIAADGLARKAGRVLEDV